MQEEVILNIAETNNEKLRSMEEKQDIIEDSLQNKYNQLSKTVGKIHQNVKSSNHKYSQVMDNLDQMKVLLEQDNTKQLENKIDRLLEQLGNKNEEKTNNRPHITDVEKNNLGDYKLFMNKWFNKNLKITKNPHNV